MKGHNRSTTFYKFVRWVGAPFRYRVIGSENIRPGFPAIYVANHLGSVGPLASILSVPVRFHPWVVAEMADYRRAPRYLYDDFVHPTWHLNGRPGMAVSFLLSRISVTLINGLGSIAVDSNQGESIAAFRRSLALLLAGKSLLVFPEDAKAPADPEIHLHPFDCGFVGLSGMYERGTGERLPLIPMAVYPETRTVVVGEALFLHDTGDRREDVRRTCGEMREKVAELYRGLQAGSRP